MHGPMNVKFVKLNLSQNVTLVAQPALHLVQYKLQRT